ncbi:MAG: tRNA adenosine(34) deaminase TadA [Lachnoclostridium sp.]|jgi:tRNA(adenine34) deaminase|nr:tRNA adenosine(34) deaminase TadA [Lachnoclostridium sp.]
MTTDEEYMKEALKMARKAFVNHETPIGCVIVYQNKIIARAHNRRNKKKNSLAHAEIIAIHKACKRIKDWRLEECTMYVTLEPCPMCAGAILQSRLKRVVIGSMSDKSGCVGSVINLLQMESFNHTVEVEIGILGQSCSDLMSMFFKKLRSKPS